MTRRNDQFSAAQRLIGPPRATGIAGHCAGDATSPGGRRRSALFPARRRPRARGAFTLIELLVVLGIVTTVVALGIPLFGVLTGSRSQEAGQNLVSAAVNAARAIALNEGKYAGVLFYVDPATERTAMSLVIVQDGASGLEDPDPYEKYKTFVDGQVYRSPLGLPDGTPITGDRVIGLASNAEATFRNGSLKTGNDVYNNANQVYSRLSLYFGNYKPSVRVYRGQMQPTNATTGAFATVGGAAGPRPPQNGPFYTANPNGPTVSTPLYNRIGGATATASGLAVESTRGPFENTNWGPETFQALTTYSAGGEQQLLPIGVGVQIIAQPTYRADNAQGTATAFPERFFRTGVVMFDPQGRLVVDKPRLVPQNSPLGKYLGLTADAREIVAGVGVVTYDNTAFRNAPTRSEADWYYQAGSGAGAIASTNAAFIGQSTAADELAEEQWLDANTVPLLINRFSGSLSEGQ